MRDSMYNNRCAGYLSPSMGLKFADVPNGLAAITKAWDRFAFRLHMSHVLKT